MRRIECHLERVLPGPATFEEAYSIQEAGEHRKRAQGVPPAGYKVACTSASAQRFVGVDGPCYARLFSTDRIPPSSTISVRQGYPCALECELAVSFAETVEPDGSNLNDAIATIGLAMEIVEDRYGGISKAGGPALVADRFAHRAFMLHDPCAYRGQPLDSFTAEVRLDGELVARESTANVLGHPLNSLFWLQRALARRGRLIEAGDIVLTGAIAPPFWVVGLPAALECRLSDGLGSLEVKFEAC